MNEELTSGHFDRILVVDDTSANLKLLAKILMEQGYTVHPASDGELALRFVQSVLPDLILLDIRMPGMDGYEVCRRLKADIRTSSIPIIFISALENEHDKVKGFQAGAVDYITKPFQPEEVLARVKTHLHLQKLTVGLEQEVRERTDELATTNQRLQQELAERQRAEALLRESEERYRLVFENSPVSIWEEDFSEVKTFFETLKKDGVTDLAAYFDQYPEMLQHCVQSVKIIDVNLAALALHGATSKEELQAGLINTFTPESFDTFRRELVCLWNGRTGMTTDAEVKTLAGDPRNVSVYFSVCPGYEDTLSKTLISLVDITDRKKLEGQLYQSQKMEAVGQLAGGVAHDFNNMLSVIIGYSDIALGKIAANDPSHYYLTQIKEAGQRSVQITRQLLAFARKQTIKPETLNLNTTIESMLKLLRRIIGEDIDLVWQPGENLRPVKMDPSQIDQILANLCVNAKDAIAGVGSITIETQNVDFDDVPCAGPPGVTPGAYVMLAVSDDGKGMDKATLNKIFDPFFTTKELGKGTGLGLSTVYGIIKQNGCFINVYSEPKYGSTFKIYIPHDNSESKQVDRVAHSPAVAIGSEIILLVEDDVLTLNMARQMLELLGYQVLSTSSPQEALEIAAENSGNIKLLLTDVVMPEMTGRDLGKKLNELYSGIKCLFMSGYTANVIAHHGVLDEDVNFIQKPFSSQELAAKLREVLDS